MNGMNCPNCGAEVYEDMNVCPNCGVKLKKTCPNCGAKLDLDARYCGECGMEIVEYTEQIPYNDTQKTYRENNYGYQNSYRHEAQPKKSNNVMIVVICLLMIIVIALGILLFYMFNNSGGSNNEAENTANIVVTAPPAVTQAPVQTEAPAATVIVQQNVQQNAPQNVPPQPVQNNQAPPAAPQQQSGYLFDSDVKYITTDYLSRLSRSQVRLILNEIYARHGYIFSSSEYSEYFSKQSWYRPRYTSDTEAESYFNSVERSNKSTIVNYEKSKGWR
jgi:hypothetical protein